MMGRGYTASRSLLAAAAILAVQGCQGTGAGDPQRGAGDAEVAWQSVHCGVPEPAVRAVEDGGAVERILERAQRNQLGGTGPALPGIDFETRRAVLIALGEQPTTGYAVRPAGDGFVITDGQARLAVELISPLPDSVQAQVMTTPCALIAIPRDGYSTLVVEDAEGPELGRIAVD